MNRTIKIGLAVVAAVTVFALAAYYEPTSNTEPLRVEPVETSTPPRTVAPAPVPVPTVTYKYSIREEHGTFRVDTNLELALVPYRCQGTSKEGDRTAAQRLCMVKGVTNGSVDRYHAQLWFSPMFTAEQVKASIVDQLNTIAQETHVTERTRISLVEGALNR